jgi:hypothetical protein
MKGHANLLSENELLVSPHLLGPYTSGHYRILLEERRVALGALDTCFHGWRVDAEGTVIVPFHAVPGKYRIILYVPVDDHRVKKRIYEFESVPFIR